MTPDTDLLALVDTMEAGPEMDALVARHVMRWEEIKQMRADHPGGFQVRHSGVWRCEWLDDFGPTDKPFAPSRDIADAWRVLEKFHAHRQDVTINGFDPYFCEIEDAEGRVIVMAEAPTAPLVICRAALRAVLQ